jgi:hypothetical protein
MGTLLRKNSFMHRSASCYLVNAAVETIHQRFIGLLGS